MLDLEISGPYKFTPFTPTGFSIFHQQDAWEPGIYFWALEYGKYYWINYVDIATQSIAQRQSEHMGLFLSGQYLFYDSGEFSKGKLIKKYHPCDGKDKFRESIDCLVGQLECMTVFFAPIDLEKALLERIESAFIKYIRKLAEESKWLDNERVSRHRKENEEPLVMSVNAPLKLRGIPNNLSF